MFFVLLVTCTVVVLCVAIHYEFLHQLSCLLPYTRIQCRLRIILGVLVALIAHTIEISIFGLAYFFMHRADQWGRLEGNFDGSLEVCIYYSFTTYTTLGFGDIEPFGDLRFLTGVESLTGLVLITWTASFLYIQMSKYWD